MPPLDRRLIHHGWRTEASCAWCFEWARDLLMHRLFSDHGRYYYYSGMESDRRYFAGELGPELT